MSRYISRNEWEPYERNTHQHKEKWTPELGQAYLRYDHNPLRRYTQARLEEIAAEAQAVIMRLSKNYPEPIYTILSSKPARKSRKKKVHENP